MVSFNWFLTVFVDLFPIEVKIVHIEREKAFSLLPPYANANILRQLLYDGLKFTLNFKSELSFSKTFLNFNIT